MMHIGFDAKRALLNDTGLGMYSRHLLSALHHSFPEHRYTLFAPGGRKSRYEVPISERVQSRLPGWRSLLMTRDIKRSGCDIYHGLSHELPLGIRHAGCRKVVTIHDVIFRTHPQLYPWLDRQIYHAKWQHSISTADAIIAISHHTASDMSRLYEVDQSKVRMIPPPIYCPPPGDATERQALRSKWQLPDTFYLCVGSLTARKNASAILEAMALQDAGSRLPLVLAGSGPLGQQLKVHADRLGLGSWVHFTGYVAVQELAHLYMLSYGQVYPSIYEGFGLPVVESLYYGRPVITSNVSSLPEAAGEGGLLINPHAPADLATAMTSLATDANLYRQLSIAGLEHARRFDPAAIAHEHINLYRQLLGP